MAKELPPKASTGLSVSCPSCKKKVLWTEAAIHRPFCSDRCQQIDLGSWADGSYAIPTEPDEQWSGQSLENISQDGSDFLQ